MDNIILPILYNYNDLSYISSNVTFNAEFNGSINKPWPYAPLGTLRNDGDDDESTNQFTPYNYLCCKFARQTYMYFNLMLKKIEGADGGGGRGGHKQTWGFNRAGELPLNMVLLR